ncbi:Uma2 family endonuclease [Pseudanabaena sp. PCC 6802]|uniref:Uma2 family endonuclease n=1 Tax=Pseudanabaena sp. PCC 6802 TaxID=118173 RepID=UPI000348837C|nr:Uma2 family endonuclease [Pseudanabaena sp. PCC 6802]
MIASISLNRIEIVPGQRIYLHDLDWQEFEQVLLELGEKRATRIAYFDGDLEIRMPLPEHERVKALISHLLVVLLEELDLPWESLGSSTFKKQSMKAGIEPDDCFYIQNSEAMIGKKRLDLTVDPPPDLAIEVDLTSPTQISAYEALGVPEIWRYRDGKLAIFILVEDRYVESLHSLIFPNLPVLEGISRVLDRGNEILMSEARKEFRQEVQSWLKVNY